MSKKYRGDLRALGRHGRSAPLRQHALHQGSETHLTSIHGDSDMMQHELLESLSLADGPRASIQRSGLISKSRPRGDAGSQSYHTKRTRQRSEKNPQHPAVGSEDIPKTVEVPPLSPRRQRQRRLRKVKHPALMPLNELARMLSTKLESAIESGLYSSNSNRDSHYAKEEEASVDCTCTSSTAT